jgi:hypothetical protein
VRHRNGASVASYAKSKSRLVARERLGDEDGISVQIAGMVARGRFFSYRLAGDAQRGPALSGMGRYD